MLPPAPAGNAFDDDNFDAYLDEPGGPSAGRTATQAAPSSLAHSSTDVPVPSASIRRKGVFLPMGLFFTSLGVIVVLLILMFVVGFFVGRS